MKTTSTTHEIIYNGMLTVWLFQYEAGISRISHRRRALNRWNTERVLNWKIKNTNNDKQKQNP